MSFHTNFKPVDPLWQIFRVICDFCYLGNGLQAVAIVRAVLQVVVSFWLPFPGFIIISGHPWRRTIFWGVGHGGRVLVAARFDSGRFRSLAALLGGSYRYFKVCKPLTSAVVRFHSGAKLLLGNEFVLVFV